MAELDWSKWTKTDVAWQKKPERVMPDHWNHQHLTFGDVIFIQFIENGINIKAYRWDGEWFRLVEDPSTLTESQKAEMMVLAMGRK